MIPHLSAFPGFQLNKKIFLILGFLIALTVYINIAHTEHVRKWIGPSATATTSSDTNDRTSGAVQEAKVSETPDKSKFDVKEMVQTDSILEEEQIGSRYPDAYYCYHKSTADLSNVDALDDIVRSKRQPTPDKTIFFVISSCFEDNRIEIRKR